MPDTARSAARGSPPKPAPPIVVGRRCSAVLVPVLVPMQLLVLLALGGTLGAGAWLALTPWGDERASASQAPAPLAPPGVPGSTAGSAAGSGPAAPPADPVALPVAPRPATPRAAAVPLAAGEVEVCGFGPVHLPSDDPNPLQRIPATVRQAALDQAEARLLASPQPAVRAAGLLIGARSRANGGRGRIQQLARLAVGTQDPVVYDIALRACSSWADAEAGSCGLLARAQWARLEPDNLQAWLALAAEAAAQNDDAAEADAMRQAAQAARSDERAGLLPALVAQALGPQAPALQRALALSLARSIQDGWVLTHSNHADSYCSADALADAGRHAVCNAVAGTLATRSASVGDVGSGVAIGRQLGWSGERLQPLLHEQQAIAHLGESARDMAASGLDFSCERLERRQAWFREVGSSGELRSLRERVALEAALAPAAARRPASVER